MDGKQYDLFSRIRDLVNKNGAEEERSEPGSDDGDATQPTEETSPQDPSPEAESPAEDREPADEVSGPAPEVEPEPVTYTDDELDIAFADRFTQAGGKFVYCETMGDLVAQFRDLMADQGWSSAFSWEPRLINLFEDRGVDEDVIENQVEHRADIALSFCQALIAANGSILLSKEQATRRTLNVFPSVHVIVADVGQLRRDVPEALQRFDEETLPFMLRIDEDRPYIAGEGRIVLNAQGPKDVFLFLCDEPLLIDS